MIKTVILALSFISFAVITTGLEDAAKYKECRQDGGSVSYCHLITNGR